MAKKEDQNTGTAPKRSAIELAAEEKLVAAEQRIAEAEAKAAEAEAKAAEAEAKAAEAEAKAAEADKAVAASGGKFDGTLPKIIKTTNPSEAADYHKKGFVVRKHGSGRDATYVVYTTQKVADNIMHVQNEVDERLKGVGVKA